MTCARVRCIQCRLTVCASSRHQPDRVQVTVRTWATNKMSSTPGICLSVTRTVQVGLAALRDVLDRRPRVRNPYVKTLQHSGYWRGFGTEGGCEFLSKGDFDQPLAT